jgi:ABC-2 type transport system ATP-binding protein
VTPPDLAVRCDGLRRVYPRRKADPIVALDDLSLHVPTNDWLALLGPNGSGKSTLIRLLVGLEAPDAGSLAILGADRPTEPATRRRVSVVFQHPGLDKLLTIRENLRAQAALFGLSSADTRQRIAAVAESVDLTDRLDDRVGSLSGGLVRRADLARALLSNPELLIVDEPTGGLDVASRRAFLDLIDATRAARTDAAEAFTVIMSTHHMDEAERADHVALMSNGRIVAQGEPAHLRSELGGRVLTTTAEHERTLTNAGLAIRTASSQRIGSGNAEAIARAAAELSRFGASFTVQPPTLADVYLAHTGARLDDAPPAPSASSKRGRRRA